MFIPKWFHGFTVTVSCFKRESYVESKSVQIRELCMFHRKILNLNSLQ